VVGVFLVSTEDGVLAWFADLVVAALLEAFMEEGLAWTASLAAVGGGLLVYFVFAILFYEMFMEGCGLVVVKKVICQKIILRMIEE
jgi:hypothetical protein